MLTNRPQSCTLDHNVICILVLSVCPRSCRMDTDCENQWVELLRQDETLVAIVF